MYFNKTVCFCNIAFLENRVEFLSNAREITFCQKCASRARTQHAATSNMQRGAERRTPVTMRWRHALNRGAQRTADSLPSAPLPLTYNMRARATSLSLSCANRRRRRTLHPISPKSPIIILPTIKFRASIKGNIV